MLALYLAITFILPSIASALRVFQHLFRFYSHPAVYIMILPFTRPDVSALSDTVAQPAR